MSALAALLAKRQVLLSAALLLLVAGFAIGPGSAAGASLILAHFGLILLWQPIVRPNYQLGPADLVLLAAVLAVFLLARSSWVLAMWLLMLAAMIAGRSFIASSLVGRMPYLIAVSVLVLFLILAVVPHALGLDAAQREPFRLIVIGGLPLLALSIAFFPVESDFDPQTLGGIDLFSAVMLFLVLAVAMLGALALMQVREIDYFSALALALPGIAAGLLLLAWVWHPSLGRAGLGVQWMRRVLSSGLSFENWLNELAADAVLEVEPDEFLKRALGDLLRFPGIIGGQWHYGVSGAGGSFGEQSEARESYTHAGLSVELCFVRPPSDGLLWHYNLMLLVLAEFYREKCQTRLLQLRSFEEAVHETGARLTHDVKNLLQSLNALCFAAARPDGDPQALQELFRRQLPQIAARLESTLDKLRQPEETRLIAIEIAAWWQEARLRHQGQGIRFRGDIEGSQAHVPCELYDTCLDNLLQNAIGKRRLEPDIRISVELEGDGRLRVSDSGSAVDEAVSAALANQPLRSSQGLGMGLYQVGRLARRAGYCLELCRNEPGAVVFELYPLAATAPDG